MSPATDCDTSDFHTIAIVGVGLIGGSIAAAIKQRHKAATVIGVGRDPARLERARQAGLIDEAATELGSAAARSDLLIFCTPVDRIVAGVREAAERCRPGTLITDAGSVKGAICHELAAGLPSGIEFVGSHPLAGSEKQGFEHADPQLFVGRICVLTPVSTTPSSVGRIGRFWQSLGSVAVAMTPEAHDRALAQTSHLPHVVAAALAAMIGPDYIGRLAATGFRDTTRIASGDPDLWTAILMANVEPVLAELQKYEQSLAAFHQALAGRDAARVNELLAAAKSRRDRISAGFP